MLRGRLAVSVVSLLFLCASSFADDWTLGAMKFVYTQDAPRSSGERKAASVIPGLVLEKVASDAAHVPSRSELLSRSLYSLQTQRLSLFLQLSREVKVRDSLVLTERDPKKLQKKRAEVEARIHVLERQIDKNLSDAAAKRSEWEQDSSGSVAKLVSEPMAEKIILYKDDACALYEAPEKILRSGMDSIPFREAVTSEKINGLLSGQIVSYGDYACVTVDLRTYPGGELTGSVTEVGTISDCMEIAANLAYGIMPHIVNTRPVRLFFDILPAEARDDAQIIIDGVISRQDGFMADVTAGRHTVEVLCDDYFSKRITYDFSGTSNFKVRVPLEKKHDGTFDITLSKGPDGSHYADGQLLGYVSGGGRTNTVQINGKTIIGQFRTKSEDGKMLDAYYYVPEDLQRQDASLTVKAQPKDTDAEIDKRRIWMYRGYSALMISLPLTFFTYGKYNAAYNGYTQGAVSSDVVNNWSMMENAAVGMSILAGGFFVFELVRYLRSADSVLPQKASAVKPGQTEILKFEDEE